MVTRKPYRSRLYRKVCIIAGCVTWLAPVALLVAVSCWESRVVAPPVIITSGQTQSVTNFPDQLIPNLLSQKDITLYQTAFRAQKGGNWGAADTVLSQLTNKVLTGHVLAQRYLNKHYTPTYAQLADWLSRYSDLPQAAEIHALAARMGTKETLPPVRRPASIDGYGDDNGLGLRGEDSPYARTWHAAIDYWRKGNRAEATRLFTYIAGHRDEVSAWTASGAAYWAWRGYTAAGDTAEAARYLRMAAEEPRSFYGILACRQLKKKLDLDAQAVALSDSDVLEMIGEPAIRRAVMLVQAGQVELAERELRVLFPQENDSEKLRLLALAREMNLAAVQISMAKNLGHDGRGFDYARYPVPHWQPEGGFTVEPSLIYALMRQESGFRSSAVSPGGALGLMQLMPQTATLMQNQGGIAGNAAEPTVNVTLGQNYVQRLLDNELVNNNLIYMLAAYNAGPGRLQAWKGSIHSDDPLLFVESIPFAQTRHYVMQVMTNYWIYSELSGKPSRSVYAVLRGQWPDYTTYIPPVAGTPAGPNG